jgi:4-azaleucine resistance transporter AzlC
LKKLTYIDGFRAAVPVFTGYFPIAVTFGLLAASVNMSLLHTFSFSAMVFAGASQFVALNMIKAGIGAGEIALAVFLLNFRHFLMSASISSRAVLNKLVIPVIAFGVTDETFAVASMQKRELSEGYLLALNLTSYAGWVTGTVTGFIAGDFLPSLLQESISICLYAMFIAILMPEVKQSLKAGVVALLAGLINTAFSYSGIISAGWAIIISIIAAASAGMIIFRNRE